MLINDNGIDRTMTAEEMANYEAWAVTAKQQETEMLAQIEARKLARQTAVAKLADLGLSQAEIEALVG